MDSIPVLWLSFSCIYLDIFLHLCSLYFLLAPAITQAASWILQRRSLYCIVFVLCFEMRRFKMLHFVVGVDFVFIVRSIGCVHCYLYIILALNFKWWNHVRSATSLHVLRKVCEQNICASAQLNHRKDYSTSNYFCCLFLIQ